MPLVDVSFTFPTSLTLHLNMNEGDDFESVGQDEARTRSEIASSGGEEKQKTFVITKWEEKGPLDAVIGFGGKTVNKLWVFGSTAGEECRHFFKPANPFSRLSALDTARSCDL